MLLAAQKELGRYVVMDELIKSKGSTRIEYNRRVPFCALILCLARAVR